jgi:folate-binding protein YgfZ
MPEAPVGLLDLGPAAAFRVRGPDRESWLQGMQTADLLSAPHGGAVYAAFLSGKGRLVTEGLLWRAPDEVVVTAPADRLQALLAHLDALLIMEDAELSPAQGLHRLRWYPGTEPPALEEAERITGSWQGLGFEMLVPAEQAQRLLSALPRVADPALVEQHRVALGVPVWGRDLDEETVPLEGGLDRALSFSKGCYVGQEVVAMATYRGRVLWNLVRLQVDGAPPPLGSLLDPKRAGKRGKVTSAAALPGGQASVLLGYVHKELIVPGSPVPLEDGRTASVLGLPFESRPGAGVCV